MSCAYNQLMRSQLHRLSKTVRSSLGLIAHLWAPERSLWLTDCEGMECITRALPRSVHFGKLHDIPSPKFRVNFGFLGAGFSDRPEISFVEELSHPVLRGNYSKKFRILLLENGTTAIRAKAAEYFAFTWSFTPQDYTLSHEVRRT